MPTLYVVATPLGHLEDITARALQVLRSVDRIAAEDTRHSHHLLAHYAIQTPVFSLHQHNEVARTAWLLTRLHAGESVALLSDAGTPVISDPGYRLVAQVQAAGVPVVPVPGPCALVAALSASGLPGDTFVFEGFLPAKGRRRALRVEALAKETRTVVLYESVHRVADLIELLATYCGGERQVVVAREMTKVFETITRLPLSDWQQQLQAGTFVLRGEYVVVVEGCPKAVEAPQELTRVLSALLPELPVKQAVTIAMRLCAGYRKQVVYEMALQLLSE